MCYNTMKDVLVAVSIAMMASNVKSSVHSIQQRPNILLLLTDDQDVVLGGADHMPFLDQHLRHQGSTFHNFFVHTATCCPSRSSILSGRYLHNIGVLNNSLEGNCDGPSWQSKVESHTFAIYAKQAGYRTGYAGKYLNTYGHDGTNRVPAGWDKWLAIVGNSQYYNYRVVKSDDGGASATRFRHGKNYTTDYFSDVVANRTLEMIREFTADAADSASNKPFLIVNAWPAPHDPIIPAPWASSSFRSLKAPRTPNWNASHNFMQTKHWIVRHQTQLDGNDEYVVDQTYRSRLQTLLSVDQHIDQFVRRLEEQGVLDNTIIIYTSDNGFQLGQHRLRHEKYHMYEHDIRVPFMVRGPNIPKNFSVYDIALSIDIAPTIYELVQNVSDHKSAPIPETMDGMSFLPIRELPSQRTSQRREDFLVSFHGEGEEACGLAWCPPPPPDRFTVSDSINNTYQCVRSIVLSSSTDFIYCRFEDAENFTEYYDLISDPWQLHNKAGKLSPGRLNELENRLASLRTCSGSACRRLWRGLASSVDSRPLPSAAGGNTTLWHLLMFVLAFALMLVCT